MEVTVIFQRDHVHALDAELSLRFAQGDEVAVDEDAAVDLVLQGIAKFADPADAEEFAEALADYMIEASDGRADPFAALLEQGDA